jgi:[ribosomal protein S5]-alanine N-acetyltransferase
VRLETERLLLRCFTKADKKEFYELIQDPSLYATLPEDHMYNREEVSEIIDWFVYRYEVNTLEEIHKFPLAIILKEDGKMLGDIGIGAYSQDREATEVFAFIGSKYWNRGYVSEAMARLMDYVREQGLAKRIFCELLLEQVPAR